MIITATCILLNALGYKLNGWLILLCVLEYLSQPTIKIERTKKENK